MSLVYLAGVLVVILVLLLAIGVMFSRLYVRATKESAFVRTGMGGQRVVTDGGALVLPVFHEIIKVNMNTLRLLVNRQKEHSLITLDRMRVDVSAEFYVRVKPDQESIATAAQTLGEKTAEPAQLMDLVEGKFVDALRSAAAGTTMKDLQDHRSGFVQKVQTVVQEELIKNGMELETVSLTSLDQTRKEFFNPENAFDAEGLTRLTEQTEGRRRERNHIEQETDVAIKTKNLAAQRERLTLEQETQFATLQQQEQIATRTAEQAALVARQKAERSREAQEAEIQSEQAVKARRIQQERELGVAEVEKQRTIETARISTEEAVRIAEQQREARVADQSKEVSKAESEANQARENAVKSQQAVLTASAVGEAERDRQVQVVAARATAEKAAVSITVQAEAERDAAEARAQALIISAQAEADADNKRAQGKLALSKADAEGQRLINEAANLLSDGQIDLRVKLALIEGLPKVIAESVKPMERISDLRIIDVSGLGQGNGGVVDVDGQKLPGTSGGLPGQLVDAAMRARTHGPLIDTLLGELGLKGGLGNVVGAASELAGINSPASTAEAPAAKD